MKLDISKMEPLHGYWQGDLNCVDLALRDLPSDYKRRLSQSFYPLNADQINYRIHDDNLFISRKIDGHLQLIVFNGEQIYMIGRRGVVRTGLPCLETAKSILQKAKVTSMIAAAELYAQRAGGERSRVYDVIAALADDKLVNTLGLAFFDMLEIDGQSLRLAGYEVVFKKLTELFPHTGQAHVVETLANRPKDDVHYYFTKWVEEEGSEGLVVRGDMPFMYKIKPKHTFDVIVVGYGEGANERKGLIKSLLVAFMRESGEYQIVSKVGGNLSEEQRGQFFNLLSQKHVDSSYIETDNEGVALHMVQPELVIEVGCNDLMTENTYGKPLMNNLVTFENGKYSLYNAVAGVRFISPVFERIRDDKSNVYEDIRFAQLKDLVYLAEEDLNPEELPQSSLLLREVYTKGTKDKIMVQKFVVWKTNKETSDAPYPRYVMYYTNFSSGRKEPLQNEIRISNSEEQIMSLAKQFIEENVKKGWNLVK